MTEDQPKAEPNGLTRRDVLAKGVGALAVTAVGAALAIAPAAQACSTCKEGLVKNPAPDGSVPVGARLHEEEPVTHDRTGAPPPAYLKPPNPTEFLTRFDYGKVSRRANGQVQRDYVLVAKDANIEIADGVTYPAWTVNDSIPGPTLRATEGDFLRIHFYNQTPRDHTLHFHGVHASNMDGSFEIVPPGGYFVYEFVAEPFGLFIYHCHMTPLRKHISRGMYGTFIIDPKVARPPANEMVMVMVGFDTEMTNDSNSFYAVNGKAFAYRDQPIPLKHGELVRIYLSNMTEFDLINSFHLHGDVFKLFRTGTRLDNYEITDTVMLCQGERCILEINYKHTGKFLFHAHQGEFSERGWLGIFEVQP
ncbi:MAG: multicopper oxidase domain-containing protein [Armatimonadota bacterium]|nr:multicopper oxidase domain-containing protein [Armatimonadota bacterium]